MDRLEFWNHQLLELECEDGTTFYTQVIKEEHHILFIQHPVDKRNVPMNVNNTTMDVRVYFLYDEKGLYQFPSKLTRLINQFALAKPDPHAIKKAERRKYFRVPAALNLTIRKDEDGETHTLFTDDISGGGVAFYSPREHLFQTGDKVVGCLSLPLKSEKEDIPFTGIVVSVVGAFPKPPRIAVEFTDMNESTRSKIIRYCFKRQHELRTKLKNYP